MSYGPNLADLWRQCGVMVAKVFAGAIPGEMPVEQPSKIELVVNQKTANALDITLPPSVLARADAVIE